MNITPKPPIVISTFGDLVERNMTMTLYCDSCGREVRVDPTAFPPDMSYIGKRFRCRCGSIARTIIGIEQKLADHRSGVATSPAPHLKAVLWPPK